jgi:hypothetical protein
MDRVGVLTDAAGRTRHHEDLFAAGECVADLARTWLASFASGARAGAAAGAYRVAPLPKSPLVSI